MNPKRLRLLRAITQKMHSAQHQIALSRLTSKRPINWQTNPFLPSTELPLIAPTIGRVVWYYPGFHEESLKNPKNLPCAAIIAYVHNDESINLSVIDWKGRQVHRESVRLVHDENFKTTDSPTCYATWMPFQIGQAKAQKTAAYEAAEDKLIQGFAEDSARDSGNDV